MDKLRECPFCGKPGTYNETSESYGYYPATISAGCEDCKMEVKREDLTKWEPGKGHFCVAKKARQIVTDRWNKRYAN